MRLQSATLLRLRDALTLVMKRNTAEDHEYNRSRHDETVRHFGGGRANVLSQFSQRSFRNRVPVELDTFRDRTS